MQDITCRNSCYKSSTFVNDTRDINDDSQKSVHPMISVSNVNVPNVTHCHQNTNHGMYPTGVS